MSISKYSKKSLLKTKYLFILSIYVFVSVKFTTSKCKYRIKGRDI